MKSTYQIFHEAVRFDEATNRPMLDVNAAMQELRQRDRAEIELEAALSWAARAIASYTLGVQTPDKSAKTIRFGDAESYADEAREHAAQVPDNGRTLQYVNSELEKVRPSAIGDLARPAWEEAHR
jgi:hypothetical protein